MHLGDNRSLELPAVAFRRISHFDRHAEITVVIIRFRHRIALPAFAEHDFYLLPLAGAYQIEGKAVAGVVLANQAHGLLGAVYLGVVDTVDDVMHQQLSLARAFIGRFRYLLWVTKPGAGDTFFGEFDVFGSPNNQTLKAIK